MMNSRDYHRIEAAIGYIASHFRAQPDLAEIAGAVHLSPYHFNRLFRRWAGITPKQFLKHLTLDRAKRELSAGGVLEAAEEAGLSGPGRLHDLFVSVDAVTPGQYKHRGDGMVIRYGCHPSPFGACVIGLTERGICHLGFIDGENGATARALVAQRWPGARLEEDEAAAAEVARQVFEPGTRGRDSLPVHLRGTNFQLKVWQALLEIAPGEASSYGQLATTLGSPGSARAVGGAVGANPVAFLIPCHRVLRAATGLGGYHWGVDRKRVILAWETARELGLGHRQERLGWLEPTG